jgi:hypothetical protein
MTQQDDRLRILRMIEMGQITAEEGARLLTSVEEGLERPGRQGPQRIRVRVTDIHTGRQKVNVNIPAGLLSVGMRLGARFGRSDGGLVNVEELLAKIKSGATGKVLELENADDGERVEVIVE